MPRSRGNGAVVGKVIIPGTSGVVSSQDATQYVLSGEWPGSTYPAISSGGGPTITSIIVTDSNWNNTSQTSVTKSNSFIKLVGTGFDSGANVFIGGTQVLSSNVTFASSSELRVALPVLIPNSNNTVSVFNTNKVGILAANTLFVSALSTSISYLIVAGGGAGGASGIGDNRGGGGGAGGVLIGSTLLDEGTYAISIGSGGSYGASGSDTMLGSLITSIGGGRGGTAGQTGYSGGSGGGGGAIGSAGNFAGGSGTPGQGNDGGTGGTDQATYRMGGAGGGAGAVGANAQAGSVVGGIGIQSSITGSSTYYGGGGGGGGSGSLGGLGGGGTASSTGGVAGNAGETNTGGGGGGSAANATVSGGGGSGILIISYAGPQVMTGGTVTSSGGNTIHTFTSSATLTF